MGFPRRRSPGGWEKSSHASAEEPPPRGKPTRGNSSGPSRATMTRSPRRRGLPTGRIVNVPSRGEMFLREASGPDASLPVVLLHGWTLSADLNWFSGGYRVASSHGPMIAPDLRGHGRGPPAVSFLHAGGGGRRCCRPDHPPGVRPGGAGRVLIGGFRRPACWASPPPSGRRPGAGWCRARAAMAHIATRAGLVEAAGRRRIRTAFRHAKRDHRPVPAPGDGRGP